MCSGYRGLHLPRLAVGPWPLKVHDDPACPWLRCIPTGRPISMLRPAQREQPWSEPSAVPTTNPSGKSVACGVSAHDNLASHSGSLQEEAVEKPLQAGKHHLFQHSSSCSPSTGGWCLASILPWA